MTIPIMNGSSSTARAIDPGDEAPFAWFAIDAVRQIREALDNETYLDQALALYLTHCELANAEHGPTYTATIRKLAERSGVSPRRVSEINVRLRNIKVLDWRQNHIDGSKELGPSTFTLLSLKSSTASATSSTASATSSTASATSSTASNRYCKNENSKIAESGKNPLNNRKESTKEKAGVAAGGEEIKPETIEATCAKCQKPTRFEAQPGLDTATVKELSRFAYCEDCGIPG